MTLGIVGRDQNVVAMELIHQESIAAGELFGGGPVRVSEVDNLLIDEEFLEKECHEPGPGFREEKVERRPRRVEQVEGDRAALSQSASADSPFATSFQSGGGQAEKKLS